MTSPFGDNGAWKLFGESGVCEMRHLGECKCERNGKGRVRISLLRSEDRE